MDSMRIAIYHNLPSGGAKRTLLEQVKRLGEQHSLMIYTLSSANQDFCDLRPYSKQHCVFPFRSAHLLKSPFGRLNQLLRMVDLFRLGRLNQVIARQIQRDQFDVILVHPCQFETSPSLLRWLAPLPSVYYCQEPPRLVYETMPARPYDRGNLRRRQLVNQIDPLPRLCRKVIQNNDYRNLRSARKVLVNSEYMQSVVERLYQVHPRVSYHGVDVDLFHPQSINKQDFLLSVGSLTPLKAYDFLITSLAKIPAEKRPPLVIASNFQNPPEQTYLSVMAKERGVQLQMVGSITDDSLVKYYNQARITLYAPLREPFGLVPLEAMACAAPVVGVREGGVIETILHGTTGLLTSRNPGEFAGAVETLLDNPELAQDYGRAGRAEIMKHWTWQQAIRNLEGHLLDTVVN